MLCINFISIKLEKAKDKVIALMQRYQVECLKKCQMLREENSQDKTMEIWGKQSLHCSRKDNKRHT